MNGVKLLTLTLAGDTTEWIDAMLQSADHGTDAPALDQPASGARPPIGRRHSA